MKLYGNQLCIFNYTSVNQMQINEFAQFFFLLQATATTDMYCVFPQNTGNYHRGKNLKVTCSTRRLNPSVATRLSVVIWLIIVGMSRLLIPCGVKGESMQIRFRSYNIPTQEQCEKRFLVVGRPASVSPFYVAGVRENFRHSRHCALCDDHTVYPQWKSRGNRMLPKKLGLKRSKNHSENLQEANIVKYFFIS